MSFGKRRPEVKTHKIIERRNDPQPDRLIIIKKTLVVLTLIFSGSIIVASIVISFSLQNFGKQLDAHWDDAFRTPRADLFIAFDGNIEGEFYNDELATHKSCLAEATQDMAELIQRVGGPEKVNWMTGAKGVRRVANYVDCYMGRLPSAFCQAAAKDRLIALVMAYLKIQAVEWRREREERALQSGVAQLPDPALQKMLEEAKTEFGPQSTTSEQDDSPFLMPDPRIKKRLVFLFENGVLKGEDFAPGFFDTPPELIEVILEETSVERDICT